MACDCSGITPYHDTTRPTFTITGDSYTLYFTLPEWKGPTSQFSNAIARFDFWESTYDVEHIGKETETYTLTGVEYTDLSSATDGDREVYYCLFGLLDEMVNNGEELVVSGIDECIDDTYVVRRFHWETVPRHPFAVRWILELEHRDWTLVEDD
jgi:hypothetical protein